MAKPYAYFVRVRARAKKRRRFPSVLLSSDPTRGLCFLSLGVFSQLGGRGAPMAKPYAYL